MRRFVLGLRAYLRDVSGDTRFDAYVDRCRAEGTEPMSRRDYERHRSDHRDAHPQGRCC
jgi:uncharacterized short protein YbdD (DUF466 family)